MPGLTSPASISFQFHCCILKLQCDDTPLDEDGIQQWKKRISLTRSMTVSGKVTKFNERTAIEEKKLSMRMPENHFSKVLDPKFSNPLFEWETFISPLLVVFRG
jgi:hypothetical protein